MVKLRGILKGLQAALSLVFLVAFLGACAQLDLPQKSEAKALLVVAKQTKNTSFDSWARKYALELESLDDSRQTHEVWLENNRETLVVINELEPGPYFIKRLKWVSASGWRFAEATGEGYPINLEFTMHDDRISILPLEFKVYQDDQGSGIVSHFEFEEMSAARSREVKQQIQRLPNADQWQLGLASLL